MKQQYLFASVISIFVIILFFVVFSSETTSVTASAKQTPTVDTNPSEEETEEPVKTPEYIPTGAPLEVLGQPAPEIIIPTLTRPLNKSRALQKALEYDQAVATKWDKVWSLDTPTTEPDRIQAELVSLGALEPRIGRPLPDMDREELVWEITVHGTVQIYGAGWSCKCSGVTYLIWPKTGEIFGILSVGPALEKHTYR